MCQNTFVENMLKEITAMFFFFFFFFFLSKTKPDLQEFLNTRWSFVSL